MQAFILAGGFGSRLRPLVADRPKPMAIINGKPFLEFLISELVAQGITDIVLGVGYLSNQIEDYFGNGQDFGVKIRYSKEDQPLGTGGAIRNAIKILDDDFLVLNGDTFVDLNIKELIEHHQSCGSKFTIVLTKEALEEQRGSVLIDQNGFVTSFNDTTIKDSDNKDYTNAGIYIINKSHVKSIKRQQKVSLENAVIPSLLWAGEKIMAHVIAGKYYDIGTPDRFKEATKKLTGEPNKYSGKANLRVSFFGGGTDLEEFYSKYGGRVISSCINREIEVNIYENLEKSDFVEIHLTNYGESKKISSSKINHLDGSHFDIFSATLHHFKIRSGISIEASSDIPPESGLATSSATVIALIRAIGSYKNLHLTPEKTAETAIKIERVILKQLGGVQDQYQISYGGLNSINIFPDGRVELKEISITEEGWDYFNSCLLMFYTKRKNSGTTQQTNLIKNIFESKKTIYSLKKTLNLTQKALKCLIAEDFDAFGKLLDTAWLLKKKSNQSISNPEIDKLYNESIASGALGGKLLGAGSGGCFLVYSKPENIDKIKKNLIEKGGQIIDFKLVSKNNEL